MNLQERLHLHKMIKANDVTDNTELIQKLKHSDLLLRDIKHLLYLKKENLDKDNLETKCFNECNFLSTKYTDLYNRLYKDELNIDILYKFIEHLKEIEDGKVDQHEASFKIGKLLKELYIDSALKKADKIDKINRKPTKSVINDITWDSYKQNYINL